LPRAFDPTPAIDQLHEDELTVDQRLRTAKTKALLSTSQESPTIHQEGIDRSTGYLDQGLSEVA
jgi:hypothetical protein